MAGRGGLGIELDLDHIPLREANLTPYEILLSESQERMLIVAERGREAELQAVFEKWDLHAVVIGDITDDGAGARLWHGQVVADIPVGALSDDAPVYDRPAAAAEICRNESRRIPRVDELAIRSGARAARVARESERRFEAMGLSPVRFAGAEQHGARPGQRRRGPAHQGFAPRRSR